MAMVANGPELLPFSAACLAITALCSVPALSAAVRQFRLGAPKDNFYQDRDGTSTPEAVAAFSNKAPKTVLVVFTALGLGTSIAISVLTTLKLTTDGFYVDNWLVTASWALMLLQATLLAAIHKPVLAHDLARWTSASSLVTLVIIVLQAFDVGTHLTRLNDAALPLRMVNVASAIVTLFAGVLMPRRPHVYFRGEQVDSQFTSSTLSRYTWSWTRAILDLASKKGDLEGSDIPQADHTIRAEEVMADWNSFGFEGKLIWSILYAYKGRFALQWSVTIIRCLLGIGPFWVMLQLIGLLQERGGGGDPSRTLWELVILLGVLSLAGSWMDSWVTYYSITMISQPLKAQLSALIYGKSLRRKNVKSAEKTKDPATATGNAEVEDPDEAPDAVVAGEDANAESESSGAQNDANAGDNSDTKTKNNSGDTKSESSVLKSQQAIVNLVGVDTRRIGHFAALQFFIVSSLGRLILYSAFLITLIGWLPFVVGIIAWALVLPINTYFSRRYVRLSEKLMKARDEKLAVINEALLGMRQIKFAALEEQWERRIMDMRDNELHVTWQVFLGDVVLFGCWVVSPIFLAAAALAAYALLHGTLTPDVAFVSISIFKSLEVTLGALPEILTVGFDTFVSVKRIDTYLKGPEIKKTVEDGLEVAFENAAISWPTDGETDDEDRFILRDLNLKFPRGELSVISGKTGTGKSLVLSALIGEADLLEGKIFAPPTASVFERHDHKAHPGNWILPGSIAYVAQTPWLESATLRDNILFGLPLNESRYNQVLDVCALNKDLEILTDGDKTELGANGINLSGGQKWRISLARAIYSRAEILIMDDIFSAVDAHVGRQIYDNCIGGQICRGRTRILVTHHIGLVQPLAKFIVELGEGTVLNAGMTSELRADGTLQEIRDSEASTTEVGEDEVGEASTAVSSDDASAAEAADTNADGVAKKDDPNDTKPKKFIQEEKREKGTVKKHVYLTYMKECGGLPFWVIFAILYLAFEAGNVGRGWWVRIWTGSNDENQGAAHAYGQHGYDYGFSLQQTVMHVGKGPEVAGSGDQNLGFYLGIYIGLSMALAAVGTFRFFWSFIMSLRGSRTLFVRILNTVLRTPLRWLDTVPVGRVLNRLTSDFEVIDQSLATDLSMLTMHVLNLGGVCIAATMVSPYALPLAAVLVLAAGIVGKKYLDGARPMKRLESTNKSPVFELFNATLSGISTLRAFQKTNVYIDRMYTSVDLWNAVSVYNWNVNRWLSFRMSLLGTTFTTLIGIIVIVSRHIDAAMAGFTLTFALDFAMSMPLAIRSYSSLELNMNAAERVIEYSELEKESQGGVQPSAAWPTSGKIEVNDLVVGYAEDLPPVLNGLNFEVKDGERIGVIGRTGAGKSSLTLALFRFLEPRSGSVHVDNVDISRIDLHSLRSRLAIIPQDPVLFSGTIRSNLDPFNERSDAELRESLARVHLVDSAAPTPANEPSSAATSTLVPQNANIFRDLSSPISESGGNLSQGQRQLLCLARAIVARPKIMVLDEATSAVDMTTDTLIQRSIREEFTGSTLMVIAHRLSTIVDFDRVLVLSDGQVADFGKPQDLWNKEDSIFREMCESSGEKEKLKDIIFGQK